MSPDNEALREALIEIEMLRSREERVRGENALLLSVLAAIQGSTKLERVIPSALSALVTSLGGDAALLVSVDTRSGKVQTMFSTDDELAQDAWNALTPVLSKSNFFISLEAEECGFEWPASIRHYRTALTSPASPVGENFEAIIFLGRTRACATAEHMHLLRRAAALIGQALIALRLERRNATLAGALMGDRIAAVGHEPDGLDTDFQAISIAYDRMANAQTLIVELLGDLLNVPLEQIDVALQQALERMGRALELDKVCFFLKHEPETFKCRYHWAPSRLSASARPPSDISALDLDRYRVALDAGNFVALERVADLRSDDPVKAILDSDLAQSALIIPMKTDLGLLGFVIFKAIVKQRRFLPGEVALFQSVASVVGSLIQRQAAAAVIESSQAELRLQTRRLRATLDAMPDLVMELDDSGRMTGFYSDSMSGLIDAPDSYIGCAPEDVLPREIASSVRELLKRVELEGESSSVVFPLRIKRREHWFEFTVAKHLLEEGREQPGYIAIIRDVSKDRSQNDEIERLGSIARRTSNLVIMTNVRREIVWVNEAFEKRTGYVLTEVLGKRPGSFLQGEHTDPDTILRIREALDQGRGIMCEVLNYDRNGEPYWVEIDIQPSHDASGNIVGFMAVKTDITERKRRVADLERAEQQARADLSAAADASRDGIAVTDPNGNYLYMNKAHQELFAVPSEDFILGRHWSELYSPENLRFIQMAAFPVLTERGSWKGEVAGRRFDGQTIEQEVSLTMKQDGGIVCITRDIGERLRAEGERTRLREALQLAQRRQALVQMAAGLAHDFNNLIASIAGSATLIQRTPGVAANEHAERILLATNRASELVKRMLARGERRPERRRILVASALNEAVNLLRSGLDSKIQMTVRNPNPALELYADPTDVLQVILNLAVNARDALEFDNERSEIEISARLAEPADLDTRSVVGRTIADRAYVLIEVADNGVGMDEETCRQVFQPYFTTKGDQGSGLGLAIVSGIVDANSGAVLVKTSPRNGTRVQILWPQDPVLSNAAQATRPMTAETVRLDDKAILIVDDNEDLLRVLSMFLEEVGAEVAAISEPKVALESIKEDPGAWDLLITDFDMSDLNGAELAQAAKLADPDLPVVLLTGFADWRSRTAMGSQSVFDRIISKPIEQDELISVVGASLRKESK